MTIKEDVLHPTQKSILFKVLQGGNSLGNQGKVRGGGWKSQGNSGKKFFCKLLTS